jgi:predicted MFS family arabinose efflux permease
MGQGVPKMAAAGILGASGLTSILGRIVPGIVADRVGAKRTRLSALSLIFLYLFATSAGALWPSPWPSASPTGAPCRCTPS